MATVVRKAPGESDEKLIAKFRRKVLAENILLEMRDREYYKPPSIRKKERLAGLKKTQKRR